MPITKRVSSSEFKVKGRANKDGRVLVYECLYCGYECCEPGRIRRHERNCKSIVEKFTKKWDLKVDLELGPGKQDIKK